MTATIENEKKLTFWHKIAESNLFSMLLEMGDQESAIIKFQKKRLLKSILALVAGIIAGILYNKFIILLGIGLAVFVWMNEYKRVTRFYKNFLFEKQLVFNKFTRMLIPLLLQKGATLYVVLNKMRDRIEDGYVKEALERFLIALNEKPNSEKPFYQFAVEASGTDQAILFMTTLYDYQQNSYDTSILEELGRMSSQELFEGVDEIINFKLRKFSLFPTKLTMATFLIILGYAVAMIVDTIKGISL